MTGHPVSCPQNVASARGSAQSKVMLRMVELTAFSALSLAPLASVSGRREARESDLASTEPPLINVRRLLSRGLAGALLCRWSLHSCHGDGARQRVIGLAWRRAGLPRMRGEIAGGVSMPRGARPGRQP